MNDSIRAAPSLRRVRWVQVIVYSTIGIALLGTAFESWRDVEAVRTELTTARGRRMLFSVGRSLAASGALTSEALRVVLELEEDQGLRCVIVGDTDEAEPLSAGECPLPPRELLHRLTAARPGAAVDVGGLVALAVGPPPPPPWRGPPPPERGWSAPPPSPPPPPGAGTGWGPGPPGRGGVAIVYEPVEANALRQSAVRNLVASSLTALALLGATVVLWRLSRRAERLQQTAERDRTFVTLGEMSAVLAHEIRNPLAALKGHAQLLVEELQARPEEERAGRLVDEVRRLEWLVDDLLGFARSNKITRTAVDPRTVLQDAVAVVAPQRVDVDVAGAPSSWRLDGTRVRQALENLLRNALEASPADTRITATVAAEGGRLVYAVRDRGPGLPPGETQSLFEPFYTTRVHGTGLGLAVVRRVAELHGGLATAGTPPDGGAEFRIVIP